MIMCSLVIMILVDVAHGKQRHIPYRDSRLTFLLQVTKHSWKVRCFFDIKPSFQPGADY